MKKIKNIDKVKDESSLMGIRNSRKILLYHGATEAIILNEYLFAKYYKRLWDMLSKCKKGKK